jgi:hypothetical protein
MALLGSAPSRRGRVDRRCISPGQDPWVAASYCSATVAGMRPRSLTMMPWSFVPARMSALRSRLDEVRPAVAVAPPASLTGVLDKGRELPAECIVRTSATLTRCRAAKWQPTPTDAERRRDQRLSVQVNATSGGTRPHLAIPGNAS